MAPRTYTGRQCKIYDKGCLSAYSKDSCRCDDCVITQKEYIKHWKAKKAGEPVPRKAHGTLSGHSTYGCRCKRCLDFYREYNAAASQRARDRAKKRRDRHKD